MAVIVFVDVLTTVVHDGLIVVPQACSEVETEVVATCAHARAAQRPSCTQRRPCIPSRVEQRRCFEDYLCVDEDKFCLEADCSVCLGAPRNSSPHGLGAFPAPVDQAGKFCLHVC